jgi:hypothetical protein
MDVKQRINAFVQLGNFLSAFATNEWPGYESKISKTDFAQFNELINKAKIYNGWFTEGNVRKAITQWGNLLNSTKIENWLNKYPFPDNEPLKTIAVIMAGNIPLVGFHDLLSVLIAGHRALIKLSADDDKLIPYIVNYLIENIEPEFKNRITFASGKLEKFDAVIATGSDNSARYFNYYFSKYPHIIRKNRTSLALITADESPEDLQLLGNDIFDYFGLGCRNVSKILLPAGYDLNNIFRAIYPFHEIIHHKKYGNNYDFNRAIYLLNRESFTENGFLIMKPDNGLHSPLAVVFYEFYENMAQANRIIEKHLPQIQCIVGKQYVPFGKSQQPELWDYADNIDTINFLLNLN